MTKQDVYDFLTTIPEGKVVTYGQIGEYFGNKHFAQTVGNFLNENPDGIKYPCYKVVNAKGYLAENYAFGGLEAQRIKLLADGVIVENDRVDLKKYQYFP